MHSFAAPLTTGTVLFVATNVDDIVILTLFFLRLHRDGIDVDAQPSPDQQLHQHHG